MPLLSIIVPVYNVEKYLQRCMDSILSQTFSGFEVILVDDGSSDSSLEICREYEKNDSRVRAIHTENQGAGPARNVGLDNISPDSEFVAFVDADDWAAPDLYERLISVFDNEIDIAFCDFTMVTESGNVDYKTFCPGNTARESISNLFHDGYGGNLWNKVFRKSIIEKSGLRFENHITAEDLLFTIKCFTFCRKVSKVYVPLYFYNMMNSASLTFSSSKTVRRENDYLRVFDELKLFYADNGWGNTFEKELSWRVQLLKSDWVMLPEKYTKYHKTWPEGDKYMLSNPFLHQKMKIAMWLLNHYIEIPVKFFVWYYKRKNKCLNSL